MASSVQPRQKKTIASPLKVIIVGAGLGGLSAAISCALAGHDVLVLEGARELAEVSTIRNGVLEIDD